MQRDTAAADKVLKARSELLMDQPFFGLLATRLKLKEDRACKTMWSDAVTLGYNPEYVDSLMNVELVGLVAQLVMRISAGHPWRQGARTAERWNKASALALNPVLVNAGFRLPQGALLDEAYAGKPAELIYVALSEEEEAPPSPSAAGTGDKEEQDPAGTSGDNPSGTDAAAEAAPGPGEGQDPGELRPAPADASEDEWKMAVNAAGILQGTMPGDVQRIVDRSLQARVNWKEALRQFIQLSVYSPDYSWTRPNRRWLHQGLYLPGLQGNNINCIVIFRDTSASIGRTYMEMFNAEILDILTTFRPAIAYVVDCDAAIAQVIEISPDDIPDELPAKGGGGTRFAPGFQWIEEQGLDPACVVYLTDLEGSFPATAPDYPVIWAVPEGQARGSRAPFGDVLSLTLD